MSLTYKKRLSSSIVATILIKFEEVYRYNIDLVLVNNDKMIKINQQRFSGGLF